MLAGDLGLVGVDEPAVADDLVAADDEAVDPMRQREGPTRDEVVRDGRLVHADEAEIAREHRVQAKRLRKT